MTWQRGIEETFRSSLVKIQSQPATHASKKRACCWDDGSATGSAAVGFRMSINVPSVWVTVEVKTRNRSTQMKPTC